MKLTTILSMLLSIGLLTADAMAAPPGKDGPKGRPGFGQRDGKKRPGGPGGADRDPAQFIARLLKEFDKDGDQKLDLQELTALFKAMRERRGGDGAGPGGPKGPGRPGFGPGGKDGPGARGFRRPGLDNKPGRPGGDRPKRPAADE